MISSSLGTALGSLSNTTPALRGPPIERVRMVGTDSRRPSCCGDVGTEGRRSWQPAKVLPRLARLGKMMPDAIVVKLVRRDRTSSRVSMLVMLAYVQNWSRDRHSRQRWTKNAMSSGQVLNFHPWVAGWWMRHVQVQHPPTTWSTDGCWAGSTFPHSL